MQMSWIRATPNVDGGLTRQDAGEDSIPVMIQACHMSCAVTRVSSGEKYRAQS